MVVDGNRSVGFLSLSDLMKLIALKVELEDDQQTDSDTFPRKDRSDDINRSAETQAGSSNGRFIEVR